MGGKTFNSQAQLCECPPGTPFDRDGTCEPIVVCAAPAIANAETNQCKCESPNFEANGKCAAPAAASCGAVGMVFNPYQSACAAQCGAGMENHDDTCRPCRVDPQTGSCACVPGAAGDQCRELDRAVGAYSIYLPEAQALRLQSGDFLLGKGATIGIMEVGPLHWRAAPRFPLSTHSELPDIPAFGYDPDSLEQYGVGVADAAHGIAVAGIMAAQKNGDGLVGVAPESDYLYGRVNTSDRAGLYERVIAAGASILNNSWAPELYVAASDFRAEDANGGLDLAQTQANLRSYLRSVNMGKDNLEGDELLSQSGLFPDPADRPIFVWSAGNNNGRVVSAEVNLTMHGGRILEKGTVISATALATLPGLPRYFPELTLNNLAVAAVNDIGNRVRSVADGVTLRQPPIAAFSNRCGAGSESYCLAAPGFAGYAYTSADLAAANSDISAIVAETFRTGYNAGFVLAPETEAFLQRTKDLPAGYDTGRGTSFAAPIVSGALALMRQYFMQATGCGMEGACGLGSHELMARVLATADKRGIYADSSVYGAGLLDLKNALTPQGALRMMSGRRLDAGASFALGESVLHAPDALGDAVRRNLSSAPLAMFDAMNAPFPVSADGMIAKKESPRMADHLRKLRRDKGAARNAAAIDLGGGGRGWLALNAAGDSLFAADFEESFANPFAALGGAGAAAGMERDGFRAAAFGESIADADANRTRGFAAEYSFWSAPDSTGGFAGQTGFVGESDSILGGRGFGGFGGTRARTLFWGARGFGALGGGWNARGAAYWGRTDSDVEDSDGWRFGADDLWSASFAAGAEREGVLRTDDALGFWLRQPLRAEGGAMTFHRPTGRTKYGELTYKAERWSARPSGRELEFSGTYRRGWGGTTGGFLRMSAGVVREAGHRRDSPLLGRFLFSAEREF